LSLKTTPKKQGGFMALGITITKKKDYVYSVDLKGPIDNDTHHNLEDELREIIDDNTKAIVLDMEGVDYVSSIGIKVILWAKKALKAKNANFAMTNLQPQINKVFDAVNILPMFDIFDDMTEADKYIDQIIKDELDKQNI